jgi:predicted metalloprotease
VCKPTGMRFNPRARLDTSQVQVRRGGGGGRGMPFPIPSSTGGRGGIGGVILLIIIFVVVQAVGGGGGGDGTSSGAGPDSSQVEGLACESGADANKDAQCALVANVNNIQAFWAEALPDQAGQDYRENQSVFFSGSVQTGCGGATSQVGPFYCPPDQTVYLDTTFFRAMLENDLGAKGGAFAEAYVMAHEYGHHVQNLLGTMGKVRTQKGPESDAVRLELQADCYAGMWAKYATEIEDANGEVFILDLTEDDITRAIDAAAAVGDDRIQQRSGGRVSPESWTHGSSAARMYWFKTGRAEGTLEACDTFAADDLHL